MDEFNTDALDRHTDAIDDMNAFDQRHGQPDSSDSDNEQVEYGVVPQKKVKTDLQVQVERNHLVMERLAKSEANVKELKETVEALQSESDHPKDKRIIELAKKNRVLQTQLESYKNKALKATEELSNLQNNNNEDASSVTRVGSSPSNSKLLKSPNSARDSPMKKPPLMPLPPIQESSKKVQELEKRIVKLRNENQAQSILLDKATKLLEREIGEVVDIESLSKEDSTWKGRAQRIEGLKAQLRKAKATGGMGDDMSVVSEAPSAITGRLTHAERNLNQMGAAKTKEFEQMRIDVVQARAEVQQYKQKMSAVNARKDTLEVQLKEVKQMFQSKIQIMLEKSENDDRLIAMLKDEVKRLESSKNVRGTLQTGAKIGQGGQMDEIVQLRGENGRLKNAIKCAEIEIAQKSERIQKLQLASIQGPVDQQIIEKDAQIDQLQQQLTKQEREIKKIQASGAGSTQGKNRDEQEAMFKDVTKQNALLRRKLDDALQKVSEYEKK